jgi:uncharacterized protein
MLGRISPRQGDDLYSNHRKVMLNMVEDTSPGAHDTLRAACDKVRYSLLGFESHASCEVNLRSAMKEVGVNIPYCPCPLNMFENCPVDEQGGLVVVPPPVKAGQYVVLRAEMDVIVAFSACPMDVFPINGPDYIPKPVAYQVDGH